MGQEKKNHTHLVVEKLQSKLFTSGLLIISCIQIKAPKENPETQH